MTKPKKSQDDDLYCEVEVCKSVEGNVNYETLEKVEVTKQDVTDERQARLFYQKSFFDIALNVSGDDSLSPEGMEMMRELQLRAQETTMSDAFDGFHTKHHLMVPPVDPTALVHMTQSLSAFQPLIDSMRVNVTGFGEIYVPTIDFDNEEDRQNLRDHFEGDLLHVLETDGIKRIQKIYSDEVDFAKSEKPSFLERILDLIPILKHAGTQDEDAAVDEKLATKTFRMELLEYVEKDGKVEFEKIRERDFERRIRVFEKEKRDELKFLKSFFKNVNPKKSWRRIRGEMRVDFETIGAWSLEVVRDPETRIPRQLGHVAVSQVRMTKLGDPVASMLPQRINDLEIVEEEQPVPYRRYAQAIGGVGKFVWFKEFGDERIIDKITGRFVGRYIWDASKRKYVRTYEGFSSHEEFVKANPAFIEGTELLYYARYNALGIPYPVPKWMGAHVLARGMIANEMVQAELFDNNMIPPLAIMVSNGRMTAQTRSAIENQLETRKRGRENYWKALIFEAESENRGRAFGNTGIPTIELKPLAEMMPTDATHQVYDEKGRLKIRSQFRLPPAHVGQESQYTRQSIQASKVAAEEQVFQPEREEDDDCFNKFLLPAMRINHWLYKTNSPPVADSQQMAQVLSILSKAGLITAGEVRPELEQLFNRPLQKLEKRLMDLPIPLVLIEAKGEMAMKVREAGEKAKAENMPGPGQVRQTDGAAENPEDTMGGRPERDGMSNASDVVKMTEDEALFGVPELLLQSRAVIVQKGNITELWTIDNGQVKRLRVGSAE